MNLKSKEKKGISQSNKKITNQKRSPTNQLFTNFNPNRNSSNSERKIKTYSQSKLKKNSRQKSEKVIIIDNLNLISISKSKKKMKENKENTVTKFENKISKNEKDKNMYIKIIKEKNKEILKLKKELEQLKLIKNINLTSYRPISFRKENKKNSFEINNSATIDRYSRTSNKSPNQNSFLKGFNSHFNSFNGSKISIDGDISINKTDFIDNLHGITEKVKILFERYEQLNK